MISFDKIPVSILVPGTYIEMDNTKAFRGLFGMPTRVLVIGQKLPTGTQAPLLPALINSKDQAVSYFGKGSQLAHMLTKFKAANSFVEVHAIAQSDAPAGVTATGSVTFTGPATAGGTINMYIAGRRIRSAVAAADTATMIAAALVLAVNADTDLPVIAAVDGVTPAKVNFTARHKGVEGNYIDLRVNYYQDEFLPAGVGANFALMSGGTGNPLVTDVLAAIGDEWYTDIVMAYTDTVNVSALESELVDRFGPLKMIEGNAYVGLRDTLSNLITKGNARNSPHSTLMGANKSPTPPYEWAAVLGAVCAFNMQNDPARPVQTLPLPGILPPAIADCFDLAERDLLLKSGISTFRVDAGGTVVIERVVTTYKTNAFGASDPSYRDIETLKTLAYLRFDLRNFISVRYPRYKLADDGTRYGRGQNVVTPSVIKTSIVARFIQWEEAGLVENIDQFKNDLIVERDASDPNRVNCLIPADIINQLRVVAAKVEFRL